MGKRDRAGAVRGQPYKISTSGFDSPELQLPYFNIVGHYCPV